MLSICSYGLTPDEHTLALTHTQKRSYTHEHAVHNAHDRQPENATLSTKHLWYIYGLRENHPNEPQFKFRAWIFVCLCVLAEFAGER